MRLNYVLIILILLGWACSTPKSAVKVKLNEVVAESDSISYELLTFDSKFESWYVLQNSPAKFRSQSYYENWNRQYVSAWNFKATQPSKGSFFGTITGYEPNVDYGFDINHKLFYYFQYVENVLKIEIMPNGPKAGQY
jgi:hypothetical protein